MIFVNTHLSKSFHYLCIILVSTEKSKTQQKLQEVESKLKSQSISEAEQARAKLTKEELAKQEEEFRKKEAELEKKDKETPWNVDTLSKDGFSKTILNKFVFKIFHRTH